MTTFSQSTQFPSQQLKLTTTNEDHESEQSSANTLDTASLNPSLRLGDHQGTFTRQPTQTPTLDTKTVNTLGFQQDITISTEPITIQMGQNPTPIVYTNNLNPGTELVSKAKQGRTNNPQVNNKTKKDLFHTDNNPHAVAAPTSKVPNSTKDTTLSDRVETIAQTSQGDGTSTTSSIPTPGIEPNMSHTHRSPHKA